MRVSKGQTEKRKVTFKVRAPSAKGVTLVGDFNNWDAYENPMKKADEGFRKVTVLLAPWRYEYKLLIDGRWWEDITGVNSIPNPLGLSKSCFLCRKSNLFGRNKDWSPKTTYLLWSTKGEDSLSLQIWRGRAL